MFCYWIEQLWQPTLNINKHNHMYYILIDLDEFITLIKLPPFRTPSWILRLTERRIPWSFTMFRLSSSEISGAKRCFLRLLLHDMVSASSWYPSLQKHSTASVFPVCKRHPPLQPKFAVLQRVSTEASKTEIIRKLFNETRVGVMFSVRMKWRNIRWWCVDLV